MSRTKENCVGCPKTRNSTLVIGMTSLFCSSNEKGREKGLLYNTTTTTAPTVVAFPASRLDSEAGNDGNGTLRLAGNQLCPRPEATEIELLLDDTSTFSWGIHVNFARQKKGKEKISRILLAQWIEIFSEESVTLAYVGAYGS